MTKQLTLPDAFVGTSIDEQETTVTLARADDYVTIYTSDNTMLTRLKKLMADPEDGYVLIDVQYSPAHNPVSVTVRAPARCLSLRSGARREISDEQREALAARMKGMAAARKAKEQA